MPHPPKQITCRCGHVSTLTIPKLLCVKCGKYVFYDDKEKRRHRVRSLYTLGMFAAAITLVTYLFIEMIVTPLLGR